jgi:hypothetical protein
MLQKVVVLGVLLLIVFVCGTIINLTHNGEGQEATVVKTVPVSSNTNDSTKLVPTMFVKSGISPSSPSWNSYVKEANKTPTLNSTFKAVPKAK